MLMVVVRSEARLRQILDRRELPGLGRFPEFGGELVELARLGRIVVRLRVLRGLLQTGRDA